MRLIYIPVTLLLGVTTSAFSQPTRAPIASSDVLSQISMFTYDAGQKSSLELRPTPIATDAEGWATVEFKKGNADIEVKVKDLPPPPKLGPYTTYILWALTPDGRATSQGVLVDIEGGKGKLKSKYPAPQFALIVTAEPHSAASVPSKMIVLYNVGDKVKGRETKVTSLTERADYSNLRVVAVQRNRPPEMVAAEYAVAAAEAAGAQQYAPELYTKARQKLTIAEGAVNSTSRRDRKDAPTLAQEAVQAGEDARRDAIKGKAASDSADREALAAASAAAATAAEAADAAAVQAAVAADAAAEQAEAGERAKDAAVANATSRERAAQKQELLERLNKELPTRKTDLGLVSEVGGVQFATGTAELSAAARESLARFAGIIVGYPELKINVEGHTDSTGSDATNEALSLRRAIAVRDYLISQHVPASSINAEGFASSHPIADNGTADGRARNRRVEIAISGGPLSASQ